MIEQAKDLASGIKSNICLNELIFKIPVNSHWNSNHLHENIVRSIRKTIILQVHKKKNSWSLSTKAEIESSVIN